MSNWIALDVGHTTGLYVGQPLSEAPHIRYVNSAALALPLDTVQEKSLHALFSKADLVIVEYPVINRMSTMQRETRQVITFWESWLSQFTVPIMKISPSLWKPFQTLAPTNLIMKDPKEVSQHEKDAAVIAWFWSRRRNLKRSK